MNLIRSIHAASRGHGDGNGSADVRASIYDRGFAASPQFFATFIILRDCETIESQDYESDDLEGLIELMGDLACECVDMIEDEELKSPPTAVLTLVPIRNAA